MTVKRTPLAGSDGRNIVADTNVTLGAGHDNTTIVQAFFDSLAAGTKVVVPYGAVIALQGQITLNSKIELTGLGELRFESGIDTANGLLVKGNGSKIRGITVSNPNLLGSATGTRSCGIRIEANDVSVTGTIVDSWQNGIQVGANGEWTNHTIHFNRVKDVIGAGNAGGSNGEDRGDGITTWGAKASIVGNIVNCKTGYDARIGIHAESLPGSEVDTSDAHRDQMVTVASNVIYGQFRRGIVIEGIAGFAITGNQIADPTWWGIAIITGSRSGSAVGNTVLWSRTSSDTQGSSWTPVRAPFMFYGSCSKAKMVHNVVEFASGSAADAVCVWQGTSGNNPTDCAFDSNDLSIQGSPTIAKGLYANSNVTRPKARRNNLAHAFTDRLAYMFGADDFDISDNDFDGGSTATKGIESNSTTAGGRVRNNRIKNINGTAILLPNHTAAVYVDDNIIASATKGIDLAGCTGGGYMRNNAIDSATVTTLTANIPAAVITAPASEKVEVFTASGTWTPDTAGKTFCLQVIGGGGGGGSGARQPSGTNAYGGGGGSGGSAMQIELPIAAILSSTYAVTVGTGGGGGASVTSNGTSGNNGTAGGSSSVNGLALGRGGNAGSGGTTAAGAAGAAVTGQISSGAAGASASGTAGGASTSAGGPASGGAGGAFNSSSVAQNGGAGSDSFSNHPTTNTTAGTAPGGVGSDGTARTVNAWLFGRSGGGGAGGDATHAGGTGGTGGKFGAGGGGGGGTQDGRASGAGGNGADGIVVITTRY